VHGHREPVRVGEEGVRDHILGDLAADLLVRPGEDTQHVGPTDHADQAAAGIDDGEALQPQRVHQPGRVAYLGVWVDRHGRVGHQVRRGGLTRGRPAVAQPVARRRVRAGDRFGGLRDQVGLGDHPGHLPVVVDDREAADPVLAEQGRHLPVRGAGPHRHHVGGHDVPHVCLHVLSFACLARGQKRRRSLHPVPKVPPIGPWPEAWPGGFLQVSDQGEDQMAAVDVTATELPDGFWYTVKHRVLGPPLVTEQLKNERLSRPLALGVLSCDGLSSAAYGTEEILYALLPFFGLAAFTLVLPMTLLVLFGVMLVVLSYREVVSVYTRAGGSYVMARENFGPRVAQVAAVALLIDYVVTVAVQTAAGSAAIVSAFPALSRIPVIGPKILLVISVVAIGVMCLGNLRGIREAGRVFALPTYLFAASVIVMIITGLVRELAGHLPHVVPGHGTVSIGSHSGLIAFGALYIMARAFANGGSSLTGIEAVSNAVSALRPPEGRNARQILATQETTVAVPDRRRPVSSSGPAPPGTSCSSRSAPAPPTCSRTRRTTPAAWSCCWWTTTTWPPSRRSGTPRACGRPRYAPSTSAWTARGRTSSASGGWRPGRRSRWSWRTARTGGWRTSRPAWPPPRRPRPAPT
jgi:hypothetical protein